MRRIWIVCAGLLLAATVVFSGPLLRGLKLVPARSTRVHRTHAKPRHHPKPRHHAKNAPAGMLLGDWHVERTVSRAPAGVPEAFPFRARARGVTGSVRVYVGAHNRARTLLVGVYSSKHGHPKSALAIGTRRGLKSRAWNAVAVPGVVLRRGRTYWLVILGERGSLTFRVRAHGTCRRELFARSRQRSLPRSWKPGRRRTGCPLSAYVLNHRAAAAPPAPASPLPVNTAAPQISGVTLVGNTLSASPGAWTNAPTRFSYQWVACDAGGRHCSSIPGATASSYTVAAASLGATLAVSVTATNSDGSATASSIATGLVGPAGVRVFYISYSSGSDSNGGTSESAPWQHAPGMNGCNANCASYRPAAGDRFIFRGGDTWPNGAFPLSPIAGSAAGEPDYFGVETGWYSGSSFTPPIFDANSTNITGTDRRAAGPQDTFFDLRGADNVTIDDIEFLNWTASGISGGYGSCAVVELNGDTNVTINRILVTGLSIDSSGNSATCAVAFGSTNAPFAGSSILENSTITGNGNTYGFGAWSIANVENNTISGIPSMVYPSVPAKGTGTISGNLLYDCGYPAFPAGASNLHSDVLLVDVTGNPSTLYVHDNVIHDTGANGGGECESIWVGNAGETDYVWNNVVYNLHGSGSLKLDGAGTDYVWDNTLAGASNAAAPCVVPGHTSGGAVTVQDNACISNAGSVAGPFTPAATQDHNLLLTTAQANRDVSSGLLSVSPYAYAPTLPTSPGAAGGTNLSTRCSGNLASLCLDTTYASRRTPVARPGGHGWQIGAYQEP